ncbi:undecaprenyl-diphosphate phosphatase [Ostreibacterium oceani]|uniref:Undecaprenyl-diphosphatase n=1 Tax=Ostreibacterium oceani TaxID=2654998 RepID=A0A6N7EV97_9GAMM|nr:undecaprenyl-diphosphate phosphatase [Ostreibacterium oceani]MPV85359.1 undecaprenyl-diphosphate phosphatase [Ostreibacterium oceani]
MDLLQTIFLAIIQGITEFLPISSSAHLILASDFFGWPDQGTAFDLALHVGTLCAVVIYFRHDLWVISRDTTHSLLKRQSVGQSRMGWFLVISTIPAALFGLFLLDIVDSHLRSPEIIVATTIGFAVLLWLSAKVGREDKDMTQLTLKNILLIGIAQALALIPGTSRSGATITMALFLGYDRQTASRFSFLLAVPITFLATLAKISNDALTVSSIPWLHFLLGAVLSFLTAIAAIHYFLRFLNRFGMMPYVIYRLVLAGVIVLFLL